MPTSEAHRILVVANRSCPCPAIAEAVHRRAGEMAIPTEVKIVAPALNSRLKHWVSDHDEATSQAQERLDLAISNVAAGDVSASGELGDADPMIAIEDSLDGFAADELVISTFPPERSNWLEKDLLARAQERFALPTTHLVSPYGQDDAT